MKLNGWTAVKLLLTIRIEITLAAVSLPKSDSLQKSVQRHNWDVSLILDIFTRS